MEAPAQETEGFAKDLIIKALSARRFDANAMPAARRLPPPWIVDEHPESFIVRDATGQALGYSTMTTSRAAAQHRRKHFGIQAGSPLYAGLPAG